MSHRLGVNSIKKTGSTALTGDVTLSEGTGVTLTQSGNDIAIAASGGSGSGDVVGPASSTDNALARFDATTGKLLQGSLTTVDDTGKLSAIGAAIEGGDFIWNAANGSYDFKLGGATLDNMIHVRKFFDRIGFGRQPDYAFDVDLEAKFRSVVGVADGNPDSGKAVNVDFSQTATSGDKYGLSSIVRADPTGASSSTYFGAFLQAQSKSGNTQNQTNGLRGAKVFVQHNGTGTIAKAYGAEFQFQNTSTGTITDARAFNVVAPTNSGGGTITTAYGVHIENITVGGTNYALKTGTGLVDFGDNVSVAGNIAVAGTVDGVDISAHAAATAAHGATGAVVGTTNTQTLTGKRITPRVGTTTSSATPTINTDDVDGYSITGLAADITSMTTNLSGTPTDFQKLMIRIKDNGTARAIAWGASFQDGTAGLPTTTVAGKTLLVGLVYDSADTQWTCEAVGSRA